MALTVNAAARVWSPFKDLQVVVEAAIHKRQTDAVHDLEVMLKKHKTDFLSLLKNIPKNLTHREAVKKSVTVGLQVHGEQRTQTFPVEVIEEAIIISDLFDLNEYAALELLLAGEDNKPDFPGLTRGLVAVLLYYDGRRSLVTALRTLILALEGRTWTLGLPADLAHLINNYVQKLVEENLTNKILGVLKTMNLTAEIDKLQNNRALGPPKHRKQVSDMYEEIQVTCAECLFSLACQRPLSKDDTLQVISHLKGDNLLAADGTLSPVTLALLMALLYCFDVSVLEKEDAEEVTGSMPVFGDPSYVADIHKELRDTSGWGEPGLGTVAQFAWGVMLRQLSQYPMAAGASEFYEEDETFMDTAMAAHVFCFLDKSVVSVDKLHKEEFYVRRLHGLVTDFIYHMPLKVKEIRNRGDETARILMAHLQEGQDPPGNLRRDFEELLSLICSLYEKDPLHLDLALDFWCPPEPLSQHESFHHRPPQRQVALYKFVRMAGDLLPATLYVPYIKMLTGLASTTQSAQHCYNLLKMNGNTSSPVSWDHIFTSLNQYFSSLRRETPTSGDQSVSYRMHSRAITPQELEGLQSVLELVRRVCEQNENCRILVCENQHWSVVMLLFGLVSCSVPPHMKSVLLRTLTALARTPEIAATLWQTLEASQILVTIPSSLGQSSGGFKVELEEVESRNEEYPMTRAFLEFLTVLTDTPVPAALGAGLRSPGIDPYLAYIRDDVLLRFGTRAYVNSGEKWEIAASCLGILHKLLQEYDVQADHFVDQVVDGPAGHVLANKPAGFTILLHMLRDSRLFQMVVRILDDTMKHFETFTSTAGQKHLERSALLCLQLLGESMVKEDEFVAMVRESGASILVTPLNRLLLSINPRTGKADFIVTITKYLMFNSTMPEHALSAMRILYMVCKSGPIQAELITLYTEHRETNELLLHGFVECLETDDAEDDQQTENEIAEQDSETSLAKTRISTRQHLLKLLISSLDLPAPNLAHYLLGFEIRKPVSKTNLQDQGILSSQKTCLHSILAILTKGVGSSGNGPQCLVDTPTLAELCYKLIYLLSANKDTSLPTLRYLRTSHDFLYRQIQHLPYEQKNYKHPVARHQSWLLKTVAVELRVTSLNRQRSHTQRLMKLILDDFDEDQTYVLQPVGGADESELLSSRLADINQSSQYSRNVRGRQYRRRIMSILDTLSFHQQYPEHMNLEFFDTNLIQQVVGSTERKDEDGVTFYDVKTLHRILLNELNNLQGTTMAGQRQRILEEIEDILRMVIERNKVCQSLFCKQQGFDSWRQVVEVILSACPADLLQGETRQTVLFEILQDLLKKVADDNALPELTAPVSGVLLTLMANLRQCFMTHDELPSDQERRDLQYVTLLDRSAGVSNTAVSWDKGSGSRTLFATSLQMVLKGLIEHTLRCSGAQQRVRARLYGALLYYLQIASKPKSSQAHLQEEPSGGVESRLLAASDTEFDQLRRENIATILTYGDSFMDLLCRDACDGLDVGRMLALSVLDCILMMDKFNQWLSFITSKGYLQHLVDSLAVDDEKLMALLGGGVNNLKVLYLYESKLSLLTRVAETAVGATTLLRCGVMQKLAECSFFDMRPDMDRSQSVYNTEDDFLPDPVSRYRHLLFTSLRFCLAILTSLGSENREAGTQVMQFIISHGDIFHSILLDRRLTLNLHALQELALTTAVICRANSQEEEQYAEVDSAEIEFRGHKLRIQRHMVSLLPKYCVSEKLTKQLKNLDVPADDRVDVCAKVTQAYLEVATNVTSFCRALVSNSGPNVQYCRVLFWPNMEEAMVRDLHGSGDFSMSTLSPAQLPNLGIVVYELKQCTNQFLAVYETRKLHLSKLQGLSELSVEDLKQFSGIADGEKMSSQQRQGLARRKLSQIIAYNYRELQAYSFIIENTLFLLWRHLEYYLLHCVPSDRGATQFQAQARRQAQIRRLQDSIGLGSSPSQTGSGDSVGLSFDLDDSRRHVRQQDIEALKQAALTVCSESLFKKILEINQTFCKSRSHYGFVEAVVRRIRRLLRLHTGS
ncbi:nuclear pore complex protein Nup205-like isoform X2 [Dreissena polymorpha]|uniref:nuclear pore complex protein Nup205-like isoform X2 n=1 Tax=Dreissena polymorpha TaxID=45954 RepID=UPI0022649301|nr:nuclear pore complex protein Nup205-like isoform X2 [Dreissena polymorpha]